MADAYWNSIAIAFIATIAIGYVLLIRTRKSTGGTSSGTSKGTDLSPPLASPHVPVFGNALEYKKDPVKFLLSQSTPEAPVFTINMAGLRTAIMGSREALRQFSFCPESVLSAREAVADFGFRYTLGDFNVFTGTDIHKRVVKDEYFTKAQLDAMALRMMKYFSSSIASLVQGPESNSSSSTNRGRIADFLDFSRRVMLRSMFYEMIGPTVLHSYASGEGGFMNEFMDFQDAVEDATAKAAVLPTWLALPACLWSCAKKRRRVVGRIEDCLLKFWTGSSSKDGGEGLWLRTVRQSTRFSSKAGAGTSTGTSTDNSTSSGTSTGNSTGSNGGGAVGCDLEVGAVAELIAGLMFAAHKNPAIGAAQTVLFILENSDPKDASSYKARAVEESRKFMSEFNRMQGTDDAAAKEGGVSVLDLLEVHCPFVRSATQEALRLTGHTIGAIRKVVSKEGWRVTVGEGQTYLIPHGSYVGASHIVPNISPRSWGGDANRFDPGRRELKGNAEDDLVYSTFSAGVHKCPGARIAHMIIALYVVVLFGSLDVDVPEDAPVPKLSFERATLAQRDAPCVLKYQVR